MHIFESKIVVKMGLGAIAGIVSILVFGVMGIEMTPFQAIGLIVVFAFAGLLHELQYGKTSE